MLQRHPGPTHSSTAKRKSLSTGKFRPPGKINRGRVILVKFEHADLPLKVARCIASRNITIVRSNCCAAGRRRFLLPQAPEASSSAWRSNTSEWPIGWSSIPRELSRSKQIDRNGSVFSSSMLRARPSSACDDAEIARNAANAAPIVSPRAEQLFALGPWRCEPAVAHAMASYRRTAYSSA